jgi:zinc transport system permease protein
VDLSIFELGVIQRALAAGSLLAALLALLGAMVTARGLAYLGDGLSHAAFGGIALGMFLGLTSPFYVAIPFTAVAAIGIGELRRRAGMRSDVAMAVIFAVCFALGTVLLKKAKRTEATFDPEHLLFGEILIVSEEDLYLVLGLAALTAVFFVFAWSRIAYATFDEELARLSGISVAWLEGVMLALLAGIVVAAIRLAGVVLVSAFLVIPAALGRVLGRSLAGVVAWAMLSGIVGVFVGFLVGYGLGWPGSASIVLVLAAFLALAAVGKRLVRSS